MSKNRSSVMFLGFAAMATMACPLAAGCSAAGNDEMTSGDAFDVSLKAMTGDGDPEDPPPISHNPLFPLCFWPHPIQATYKQLAAAALANTAGQMPTMQYMALTALPPAARNGCRMQALSYLIKCALPSGTYVKDTWTANGVTYNIDYYGHFGIAPEWRTGSLSASNKEWITSCLMQHLNGYQTTTNLVLEGNRSGFYLGTVPGYNHYDSITWGNLFTSTTTLDPTGWTWNSVPAFRGYVCYMKDLEDDCTSAPDALTTKLCKEEYNSCGAEVVGRCDTACSWPTGPSGYWVCGGKTTNFRERLPNLDMYGVDCQIPE